MPPKLLLYDIHIKKMTGFNGCGINGDGDEIDRAYDCIFDHRFQLERFGEASVMELVGWTSKNRPPFNNRTIRGMRFLGYDVEELVAGG